MKSFAVRLLLGASLILLAVVMASQAQKNRLAQAKSTLDLPSQESVQELVPIGSPGPAMDSPSTDPIDQPEPNPFKQDAVQLVQHSEPTLGTPAGAGPVMEITPGDMPTFAPSPASGDAPQGMTLKNIKMPSLAPKNEPAELKLPTFGAPAPEPKQNVADVAPANPLPNPLIGNVQQPGNALRDNTGNQLRTMEAPGPDVVGPGPGIIEAAGRDPAIPNVEMPAQEPLGAPEPMVRAIALPQDNTFGQTPAPNPAQAAPQSEIRMSQAGNMRIVPPPAVQTQPMPEPMRTNEQPAISSSAPSLGGMDNTFNQPVAGYGPPTPQSNAVVNPVPTQPLRANTVPGSVPGYGQQPVGPRMAALPEPAPAPLPNFQQQQPQSQIEVNPDTTMASPGDRRFDGVQSPSIVIQKRAPKEVKVGKPASFAIHVQNVGAVEALDVQVHDRVPAGMRLLDASPTPVMRGDLLVWQLGSMRAGDERTVTMQLEPIEEGELGSVARVTFEAAASVRTISTRPQLKVAQSAPEKVLIGQQLEIELEISNPGTGAATGVVLQEDVPEGLEHPKGRQLDNGLGTLAPGETRHQTLRLRAVAPGVIQNTIVLKGDDGLEDRHTIAVEVVSPNLQIQLSGPSKRYLERQATFNLELANIGTADASNVEVAAYLDRGFTFVSTDMEGQYDPSQHAVFWSLANLPRNGSGQVPLTLLPVQEGDRTIRLEAKADLGIVAKNERSVMVDSLAELTFQINDTADPIEIGGETTYEIKLTNTGSRQDSNVQVRLELPPGVELLTSDADAETDGRGLVAFSPRRQFAANTDMTYRVKVKGVQEGTHLIKAVVVSDQSKVPVTKEESTTVYQDR